MLISEEWYRIHKNDHTREEIDSLGIEIKVDGKKVADIHHGGDGRVQKEKVKKVMLWSSQFN